MNNQFTMSLTSNLGNTSEKVGVTTTVKQQCDNIQITIQHFKKCLQAQRKQQSQLQGQLTKLQTNTETQFKNSLNQIKIQSKQLTQTLYLQSEKQNKQMQYIQLQKRILEDQHNKLNQLSHALTQRVGQMEQNVGL